MFCGPDPSRWGTSNHWGATGVELLEKLAVLTVSPRGNITPYHGVLAPGAKWRGSVVRDRVRAESRPRTEPPPLDKANGRHSSQQVSVPILEVATGDPPSLRERRLSWAELMKRVFREDVLRCKKCGGRAAVISAITQPKVIEAILVCLGLAVRAPPITPARQIPFDL